MALLAFRGMGNVKGCVELLLKQEMVVMSMKCCSGFAVHVWLLEILGGNSCLGKRIHLQCVAAEHPKQLTAPTLCHFGGKLVLNRP